MCQWLIFWISINLNVTFPVIHVTFVSIQKSCFKCLFFASFYSVLFYTSLYPTVVNVEVCFLIEFANVIILIEIVITEDSARQHRGKNRLQRICDLHFQSEKKLRFLCLDTVKYNDKNIYHYLIDNMIYFRYTIERLEGKVTGNNSTNRAHLFLPYF